MSANFETEVRPKMWMIVYQDAEIGPDLIDDEKIARAAFERKSENWNCSLFEEVGRK